MMSIFKKRELTIRQQEAVTGYLFVTPFLLGFLVFQAMPFVVAIITSLTNMNFITVSVSKTKFVGFQNYIYELHDPEFYNSLIRSIYYMVLYVPVVMVLSLVVANLLNSKILMKNLVRTLLFLPYISNIVAITIVWSMMYDFQDGPINMFLKHIGIAHPPLWLVGDSYIVIPAVVIVAIWNSIGFYFMAYLAALQGIPKELYESADMEGANEYRKFMSITVPSVAPTTFFLFITATITSLQNFALIWNLTKGGPGNASTTLSVNAYQTSWAYNHMQLGATQSILMLMIPLVIMAVNWRGQRKWMI